MTGNAYFILMVVLLAFAFGLQYFRRKLVRKSREVGKKLGQDITAKSHAKHLPEAIETLSRTVTLHTDADTARNLVDGIVASKRRYRAVEGGQWHLGWINKNDVEIALTPVAEGQRLAATRLNEAMDFPRGGPAWDEFLKALLDAAQKAGIAVSEGTQQLQKQDTVPGSEATWLPV